MLNPDGLICPLDQTPLQLDGRTLKCSQGHSFDLAKQGYCHLLPVQSKRSKDPGDSKEMVQARSDFLESGAYQPIAEFIWQQLQPLMTDISELKLADAGCGEGYYLSGLEQKLVQEGVTSRLIGFDISKWAVAKATKRSASISWLVASNKQPPIAEAYLNFYLCMFGFPQYEAFAQSLQAGGYLILLDAGPSHLIELRELIYDEVRPHRSFNLEPACQAGFELVAESQLQQQGVELSQSQIQQLMLMTPHFFRASADAKAKLAELEQLQLTLDCCCRIFRKPF